MNTNGAGDGALAALLHDITANAYHKTNVPNSSKHTFDWLTYSSLAQVCKYANRVSYQVLNQHSPRLTRGCRNGKTASKRRTGTGKTATCGCRFVLFPLPAREGQGEGIRQHKTYPVTASSTGGFVSIVSIVFAISRSPITT